MPKSTSVRDISTKLRATLYGMDKIEDVNRDNELEDIATKFLVMIRKTCKNKGE
jgi:hypothetical protein